MKHLLLTLHILVFAVCTQGQNLRTKKYEKDSGYVEIVYFPSGKISTIKLTPKQMYSRIDGYARAYNLQGKQIYHKTISTVGGHGSTTFAYHPNGVIKSVRSTFQPDGGIQHYDATRYYDDKGNFLREEDNSWDRKITLLEPPQVTPDAPKKVEETPRYEITPDRIQPAWVGNVRIGLFVENSSDVPVSLKIKALKTAKKEVLITVKPGERMYVEEYIAPNLQIEFTDYYTVSLTGDCADKASLASRSTFGMKEGFGRTILNVFNK